MEDFRVLLIFFQHALTQISDIITFYLDEDLFKLEFPTFLYCIKTQANITGKEQTLYSVCLCMSASEPIGKSNF